jgi:large subunit ribosomal protein L21e
MVTRIGTKQRNTRQKYTQHYRKKGKIPLSEYFKKLEVGDKVALVVNPNIQEGRFFPRFHGLNGTVMGKKGFCYNIQIKDGSKQKTLYVHPMHLKKSASAKTLEAPVKK